jgi:uncharacterized protein YcnI
MLTSRLSRIRPFSVRPFPIRLGATALTASGLIVLASAGVASAHVGIVEDEVEAGTTALITFQFSHGCEGSPTTAIRIQMPENIPAVAPTINANWDVSKTMEALDAPIEGSHGEQLSERVSEVVYTAETPVADGYRDVFVLSVAIPEDAAGTTLFFPTIQTCESGETAWIEIPAEGQDHDDLESPAPGVAVVEGGDDEHGHAEEAAEDTVPETTGA